MFISNEVVLKKLKYAVSKKIPNLEARLVEAKRDLKRSDSSIYYLKLIKSLENQLKGFKSIDGIPFRPRSGEFYTNNCGFDPDTGRAHSYNWYDLGKLINGIYVVNSYRYSQQTNNHYYMLRSTLKVLGVKFIELEAPNGLQDLNSGRDLYLSRIGQATIAMKYGSTKTDKYRRASIRESEKMLDLLATFGIKTDSILKQNAIESAENARSERLKYDAIQRDIYTLNAYQKALVNNDLKYIVKFHKQNAKRVARGLPELKVN